MRRVLALRALGLGDLLTAVPALRALARAHPGAGRLLAAPPALAALAHLTGAVDRVVPAAALGPLPSDLGPLDVAVNLHGRGPESHRVLLALRPRRLVAFACAGLAGAERGPRWRVDEHEVDRWCRLLAENDIPADPGDLDLAPAARAAILEPRARLVAAAAGATLLHPGAGSPARRWPAERFAAVARAEAAAGRRVVVTAGPGEAALAREVARRANLREGRVQATASVLDLAALVASAARVVCGDTGVAHLATALRTPSIVLFGPTPPAWWGPPRERPWHRALWAGRVGDPHGAWPDPGLLRIEVDGVREALATLPPAPALEAVA